MAQPFDCLCGKPTCRGRISGAEDMAPEQLDGLWLNGHIRELLEEREATEQKQEQEQEQEQEQNGPAAVTSNGNAAAAAQTGAPGNGAAVSNAQTGRDGNHHVAAGETVDPTVQALRDTLAHAEKVAEAARLALVSYVGAMQGAGFDKASRNANGPFDAATATATATAAAGASMGLQRRGPTSRELSGEMGGDTSVPV